MHLMMMHRIRTAIELHMALHKTSDINIYINRLYNLAHVRLGILHQKSSFRVSKQRKNKAKAYIYMDARPTGKP